MLAVVIHCTAESMHEPLKEESWGTVQYMGDLKKTNNKIMENLCSGQI